MMGVCQNHGRGVREMEDKGNVFGVQQLLHNQVVGACDEGGEMCVREKIEKDG